MTSVSRTSGDEWFAPPSLDPIELARIASTYFGIDGELTELRGEGEQNAVISSPQGSFVLKVAEAGDDVSTLDFQCGALQHIARHDPALPVPRVVPSLSGTTVVVADLGSGPLAVRMLTYLPGRTFDDLDIVSPAGLRAVGALQGRVADVLATFEHPAADAFMPWALDSGTLADHDLWVHLGDDAARLVEPCRERVGAAVEAMASVRRHVIHNDAHRGNLLRADVSSDAVTGIIDFGDVITSAAVADLGVSGASFVGEQPDPAGAFVEIVSGYHGVRPLDPEELTLLPDMVLCRLVLSSLMTDFQVRTSPHIAKWVAAERVGILHCLERWVDVDVESLAGGLLELLDQRHGQATAT